MAGHAVQRTGWLGRGGRCRWRARQRPTATDSERSLHKPETLRAGPREPAVLPSQATRPGQPLRLPGQTRVTPEEYREFRELGHGEIFNLEVDACAPARPPAAPPRRRRSAAPATRARRPRPHRAACSALLQSDAQAQADLQRAALRARGRAGMARRLRRSRRTACLPPTPQDLTDCGAMSPCLPGRRVVDAPWRAPGADPTDFFNYGLTLRAWREYAARVARYRLEFSMQRKIQTVDGVGPGSGLGPAPMDALDADLPPELAAALRAERGAGPGFGGPGFRRPGFDGGMGFRPPFAHGNGLALGPPPRPPPPPGVRALSRARCTGLLALVPGVSRVAMHCVCAQRGCRRARISMRQ